VQSRKVTLLPNNPPPDPWPVAAFAAVLIDVEPVVPAVTHAALPRTLVLS